MELLAINNNVIQSNDTQNRMTIDPLKNIEDGIKTADKNASLVSQSTNISDFGMNIITQVNQISDIEKTQSIISNQIEITTEVLETVDYAINTPSLNIDEKQPEIKSLIDNFNHLSEGLNKIEISDEIGIFFDGILGSKPLSSADIHDAMQAEKERLSFIQNEMNSKVKMIFADTQKTLESEKSHVETKVSFKNLDYAQESTLFNESKINNIEGEILHSQANASPLYTQTLLS